MTEPGGRVLVVDDNVINRKQLAHLLEHQGYAVTLAEDGVQALNLLAEASAPFDVILLDILMPGMDGYEVLARVKRQPGLHHIPVIMISALDEMDSVIRCIELGAADYLPKPFKPALLQARLHTCLAEKRLRDLELEYLEQVGKVADAAQDVESGKFDPVTLEPVSARTDALGRLARVFQRMAKEVYLREQRLQRQLDQLRLDMSEMRRGRVEPARVWLPIDRQHALVAGGTLPDRTTGAALFADISGFTPLTSALAQELGLRRGAEELTRAINQVYNGLVAALHHYGGSAICFAGDSVTCWLDGDDGRRGIACALAMQEAMALNPSVTTPGGTVFPLSVKIAVVVGPVRRFLVGDANHCLVEVIAGRTLDRLAAAEHCAGRGETIAGAEIVRRLAREGDVGIRTSAWRTSVTTGEEFALVEGIDGTVAPAPWPLLGPDALPDAACRPWLLPPVFDRIRSGGQQYLGDLRPVTTLFLSFGGIDYDADDDAGRKLDAYVRWVQDVASAEGGQLFSLSIGDKGCYLALAFGAPERHSDDESRAVCCGLRLLDMPPELAYVLGERIGIASGLGHAGAYGSETRRTYGIHGDRVNLSARLMQAAPVGGILCDGGIVQAARAMHFEALAPVTVKGRAEPVEVYRPIPEEAVFLDGGGAAAPPGDLLTPSESLVLKVASVLGGSFTLELLTAVFPIDSEKPALAQRLARLEELDFIRREWPDEVYRFRSREVQETSYNEMLFMQRRMLHRQVALWYEGHSDGQNAPFFSELARHWELGAEPAKAIDYLEKAAGLARKAGDFAGAEAFLRHGMELEADTAVLSAGYYGDAAQSGTPDWEGAIRYALGRLEHDLSPELRYHNLWHTRQDVLPAARRLAQMSGLSEEETRLVELGAAYHDTGFLVDQAEHERAGANMVAQVLPGFGFSSERVALIQGMILATRIPQAPRTPLEQIVADADLDNLGRPDCMARSEALRAENACFGRVYGDEEWYTRQLRFMLNHSYWTEAARELGDAGKRQNTAVLEARLAAIRAAPAGPGDG